MEETKGCVAPWVCRGRWARPISIGASERELTGGRALLLLLLLLLARQQILFLRAPGLRPAFILFLIDDEID